MIKYADIYVHWQTDTLPALCTARNQAEITKQINWK